MEMVWRVIFFMEIYGDKSLEIVQGLSGENIVNY